MPSANVCMTGKENVRAVLRGEVPQRLVWAPCIDGYARSGLPEPWCSLDLFELQRHFGLDMYRGAWACGEHFDDAVRHTHEADDDSVVDVYETSLGTLRQEQTYAAESRHIPFPTKYLIESFEDLERYLFLVEHTRVTEEHDRLRELVAAYPDVMVTAGLTDTPLPALMTKLIGVENFVQMYCEAPERLEQAMQVMQRRNCRLVEAAVRGPGEVFICYENTDIRVFGIDWIERYELPFLNEYADIAHAHGKQLLVHMCGHVQRIISRLTDCRFDGIIDVAPPPTGDCDIARAVTVLGQSGKVLGGGIECNTFVLADPEQFSRSVSALVASIDCPASFLLGSGDAVPCGATLENLRCAERIAKSVRLG